MSSILGLALIITSIYFLGQNIVFTSHYYYSFWQSAPATISVLAIMVGIGSLTLWRETMGNIGWVFIGIGIVSVFLSGGVILQPTSLWTFFVSMLSFASGYQLLTRGKIRF
jgi:hypothetical protein